MHVHNLKLNRRTNQAKADPVHYYGEAEPPVRAAVGGSDFLRAMSSVDITKALGVLDELMSALSVANPKVYNGIMRKLERLQDE